MSRLTFPFAFHEDDTSQVQGVLELEQPLPFQPESQGSGFYRPGRITLAGSAQGSIGDQIDLVLYHNQAASDFIYTRPCKADPNLLEIVGLSSQEISQVRQLTLPGQLCLGSDRSRLIGQAMRDIFAAPPLREEVTARRQNNLAVFPILREGAKYQVAEALFSNYGYYCDEIVLDAHHVFDSSVPVYNRKVEMTLFKDKDLDRGKKGEISVAFIADSIASGMVLKEVIARVQERFEHLQRIEVIAPLATLRGLSRVARSEISNQVPVRVHVFETILNALPPDYYYSAHYNNPDFHILPEAERAYRQWWGQDAEGNSIADTACAGYGWSEVFFSPRKQIEMINAELGARHGLTIADLVRRHLAADDSAVWVDTPAHLSPAAE